MSTVLVEEPAPVATPESIRRPLRRRVMHVVRRAHLAFGLFLLPWAVLYGITGFLFNHPAAFSDQPTTTFGSAELAGSPMAEPPSPADTASRVVERLRARNPDAKYALVEPEKAGYVREFAFATVAIRDRQLSVLVDVRGHGGTVREGPAPRTSAGEKAPFAVGASGASRGAKGGQKGEGTPRGESERMAPSSGLTIEAPLHDRVKAAIPTVLERTGHSSGDVTITSVPDLTFLMDADGRLWKVTFNSLTGSVSGTPADATASEELSIRRFLTRMHTSHGYPGEPNAKWFWAVVVDGMAFVMVFWGVSGLFMWWQIKATRLWGGFVVLLSIAAATSLGIGMYGMLTGR